MTLTAQDRIDITDLINLHGHLTDAGELDQADELLAPDVVYDLGDFGLGSVRGASALRETTLSLGSTHPVGHHVTNIVITPIDDHTARVRSKGIGIQANGSAGSVVYDDVVSHQPEGWKISYRKLTARRAPLGGQVPDPREVLRRFRQAAVDQSVDDMRRLYAVDAVHEFPFTRPGLPGRIEGRDEIVAMMAQQWQTGTLKYQSYRTLAIHDTTDSETIIVEQEAVGISPATGDFALPNIVVLTTRAGQILRFRDYVNLVVAAAAIGREP